MAAICGCGSTVQPLTHSHPYCYPSCAKVSGVVERCGGPAPGTCSLAHVVSVELLDSRGRLLTGVQAATGHTIDRFLLLYPAPGRYTLETRVAGYRVKRLVNLRLGHTVRANLIEPIS